MSQSLATFAVDDAFAYNNAVAEFRSTRLWWNLVGVVWNAS
jgi:hypothetical protein